VYPPVWRTAKRLRVTVVDRLITIASLTLLVNQGGDKPAPAPPQTLRAIAVSALKIGILTQIKIEFQ
jgi:hypothetical protein